MEPYLSYLTALRRRTMIGGVALLAIAVALWVMGKLNPGQDYSQVVVGGALFVCGTLCLAVGQIADMLDGLVKTLGRQSEHESASPK